MDVDKKGVWAQANLFGFYKTPKLDLRVNQLIPPGQCKKYNNKFKFRVDFTAISKIFPGAKDTAKQIIYQDCCRPADKKLKQDFLTKKQLPKPTPRK
jgi:hypothetical protein